MEIKRDVVTKSDRESERMLTNERVGNYDDGDGGKNVREKKNDFA